MRTEEIKTSHDLADLLEDAARVLRMLPEVPLTDAKRQIAAKSAEQNAGPKGMDREQMKEHIGLLAEQIPELNRAEVETQLTSLTVDSIRQLAPLLDVRVPSKATKDEYVKLLLTQLFDAPAGQELIRTFHKRNNRGSDSKPVVAPRGVPSVPVGKGLSKDKGSGKP